MIRSSITAAGAALSGSYLLNKRVQCQEGSGFLGGMWSGGAKTPEAEVIAPVKAPSTAERAARTRSYNRNASSKKGPLGKVGLEEETKLLKAYRQRYGHRMVQLDKMQVAELLETIHIKDPVVIDRIFGMMDTKKEGKISYGRFLAFIQVAAGGSEEDRYKFLFAACDFDESGTIDRDELRTMLKQMWLAKHAFSGSCFNVLFCNDDEPFYFEGMSVENVALYKANRFAHDVFKVADADKNNELDLKEFAFWYRRGGKSVNTFKQLFEGFEAPQLE